MLIVPLGKKGSSGIPIFTLFVCVACVIVYVFAGKPADQLALAYYPGSFDVLKMFTSVFAHASIWHLLGNLFFFYCFARTVETQVSIKGYLLAFIVFVLVSTLAYDFSAQQPIPTLGLSGVVWGYMGIFLFRYPRDNIDCFVWYLWVLKTIEVPTFLFILAFLAFDVAAFRNTDHATVNYVAHFSGFICGALFKLVFWKLFTTEQPQARRRHVYASAGARTTRRTY